MATPIVIFADASGGGNGLEVSSYPSPPGVPSITKNSSTADLASYIFGLLAYLSGLIALISFVWGAVGLMLSFSSAEAASNSKERMKGAVFGLALTLFAFLILQTINKQLVTQTLTPVSGTGGVFLTDGKDYKAAPQESSDTSTLPKGFTTIKYCCDKDCTSGGDGPPFLIWVFDKKGLEAGSDDLSKGVNVNEVKCGGTSSIGGSYRMAYESDGVYYCLGGCSGDNGCSGYMSGANTGDQDTIPAPFAGKIKAVRFYIAGFDQNNQPGAGYGVIFHQTPGLSNGGQCNAPITQDCGLCKEVKDSDATYAANIFRLNPGSAGDGVSFYSSTFQDATGSKSGYVNFKSTDIKSNPLLEVDPSGEKDDDSGNNMCFSYTKVDRGPTYTTKCTDDKCNADAWEDETKQPQEGDNCSAAACESFQDCPGSIKIKGNYLVGLYSNTGGVDDSNENSSCNATGGYCQTFTSGTQQGVNNLKAQPIIGSGSAHDSLDKIYIIPTQ